MSHSIIHLHTVIKDSDHCIATLMQAQLNTDQRHTCTHDGLRDMHSYIHTEAEPFQNTFLLISSLVSVRKMEEVGSLALILDLGPCRAGKKVE